MKQALAAAYLAVIVAANWTLSRYGIVAFLGATTLMVPAGVYFAGLAFGIRDALQEAGGHTWTLAAIAAGAALSWLIEPTFAVASGVAFLLSELADWLVYTPLRDRNWTAAAVASNVVGSTIDSLLFLNLAFGWAAASAGWFDLTLTKALVTVPTVALVAVVRARRVS